MARDGPAALAFVENCWRRWASGSCWGDPRRRMQWRICDQQAILEALAADGWLVLGRGPEDCGQARGGKATG